MPDLGWCLYLLLVLVVALACAYRRSPVGSWTLQFSVAFGVLFFLPFHVLGYTELIFGVHLLSAPIAPAVLIGLIACTLVIKAGASSMTGGARRQVVAYTASEAVPVASEHSRLLWNYGRLVLVVTSGSYTLMAVLVMVGFPRG